MISATLDGVTFSTVRGAAMCTIATLSGWFGPPPEKTPLEERPDSDGAFGQEVFHRAARPVTLTGLVLTDGDGLDQWEELSAVMSSGAPKTLTVTDRKGSKSSLVKVFGAGSDLVPLSDGTATYILSLVAFDPVKYGPVRELSTGLPVEGGGLEYPLGEPGGALFYGENGELGRVQVSNGGTATTYPVVTVTGEMADGFFVQRLDTGQVVRYDRIVPIGTDVSIDMRTGAVVVDGTSDGSTYLSRAEFFGVEPGADFAVQFNALGATTGTPTMTVAVQDGYW